MNQSILPATILYVLSIYYLVAAFELSLPLHWGAKHLRADLRTPMSRRSRINLAVFLGYLAYLVFFKNDRPWFVAIAAILIVGLLLNWITDHRRFQKRGHN